MNHTSIEFVIEDAVAVLVFNRPDKLNSMTSAMHAEIRSALKAIDEADVRSMLLTGNGRGFCAGQDLAELDLDADMSTVLNRDFNPFVEWIRSAPFPVICAVNGIAAGAGANIALTCDIVLAGQSAKFLQAFAKIGLIPDAGGTWSLTHLVGPARAKGLAMLAEPLSAQNAKDWGLIWDVIEDDQLRDQAMALAKRLANQPTMSFALTKKAVDAALRHGFSEHLEYEASLQSQAGRSADFREGVGAFLDKREPKFKGR